jgi:hypothetical protein
MICWRCHSNSVNTGSRLLSISDVKTRKRRNVVGIDMIRNNRIRFGLGFMVLSATFNNISAILWWSVVFVEETRVLGENRQPLASHWQTYHIMLYRVHLAITGFKLTTLVVIGIDCTGNWKSNYHMITTTTALNFHLNSSGLTLMCNVYLLDTFFLQWS